MWDKIAHIIIRNRVLWLVIVGVITLVMGFMAKDLKPTYKFKAPIPEKDVSYQDFEKFNTLFKGDGNLTVLGFKDSKAFEPENFKLWVDLIDNISDVHGVDGVLAYHKLQKIIYNKNEDHFEFKPIGDVSTLKSKEETKIIKNLKSHFVLHQQLL